MPHKLNKIVQLLADNRQTEGRRFEVRAAADGTDEVEVFLYDAIVDDELQAEWWGGVAPEPFVKALRGITAGTIHLRINSPGGSVFAARTMETALREHKARIVVHIDGLAASAATFVAMAGDEIIVSKGSMFMIHKAWTYAWGNADDLAKTAALLDKIDGTLVETYVDRTGASAEAVAEWMSAETWFTAAEAVEHGFADKIAEAEPKPETQAQWNLRAYLAGVGKPAVQTSARAEPPPTSEDHRARQQQRVALLARTQFV